jgi:mannose-6-phosphate isomerase-like protein (cupin superfamily)
MKRIDYKQIREIMVNGYGKVKESLFDPIGFARVEMAKGLSTPAYHKATIEYYLVVSGEGTLRTKLSGSQIQETNLSPGVVVKIDVNEIHQVNNPDTLVIEAITYPAWTPEDEISVEESLF